VLHLGCERMSGEGSALVCVVGTASVGVSPSSSSSSTLSRGGISSSFAEFSLVSIVLVSMIMRSMRGASPFIEYDIAGSEETLSGLMDETIHFVLRSIPKVDTDKGARPEFAC